MNAIARMGIEMTLNKFPEVIWDRFTGTFDSLWVFGWIARADAHKDFLVLHFEDYEPDRFITSSAQYSEEFGRRLDFGGEHRPCLRVEDYFPTLNCVRLFPGVAASQPGPHAAGQVRTGRDREAAGVDRPPMDPRAVASDGVTQADAAFPEVQDRHLTPTPLPDRGGEGEESPGSRRPACGTELQTCPICGPIVAEISSAMDFLTLAMIRRRRIQHAAGITDEQRGELVALTYAREDELGRLAGI